MSRTLRLRASALIDQALRIVVGNGLPLALLADMLGMGLEDVDALATGSSIRLWPAELEKLDLFCAIIVGFAGSRRIHMVIEDGRFFADLGSPLLSVADEGAAMAAFDVAFAALLAEVR